MCRNNHSLFQTIFELKFAEIFDLGFLKMEGKEHILLTLGNENDYPPSYIIFVVRFSPDWLVGARGAALPSGLWNVYVLKVAYHFLKMKDKEIYTDPVKDVKA
ncbi:MAG: hypothetical protein NEHIOOID_00578 [Holosporales bacterium]